MYRHHDDLFLHRLRTPALPPAEFFPVFLLLDLNPTDGGYPPPLGMTTLRLFVRFPSVEEVLGVALGSLGRTSSTLNGGSLGVGGGIVGVEISIGYI